MIYLKTTYRTLSGTKEVIEIPKKTFTQWIIYQDNKPKFYVDFYDLEKESNSMMNSLVLCTNRTIEEALILINKKNNINLSVPKISKLGLKMKLKSEFIELDLQPIPLKWLGYSL
ncbi:hypothetical protein BTO04_09775 [Polaribacter sp. SA4-10]|uniref:hypothetical protein n=1 Tax=Polaribacter sp. SA4-10 TaxID=754397 RepID=UPI000B3CA051|nr:hypothetical protein [Polaribacter sp. SA4-10]ARV06954.1 hypothetical protein BTO04_09775 [Polaribacter sp. SA4-10]